MMDADWSRKKDSGSDMGKKRVAAPEGKNKGAAEASGKRDKDDKKKRQRTCTDDGESHKQSSRFDCSICMERKQPTELFTVKPCTHKFCIGCVGRYVAAKVEARASRVGCPDPQCKDGVLEPETCKSIVPEGVLDSWGVVLCESALGTEKFYCPFNDCSALLVNEEEGNRAGAEVITNAECPHCHRMFCAQCKVPWHSDISCKKFQRLLAKDGGGNGRENDALLKKLAADKKWQRCPACGMYVEKKGGCWLMRCRCGSGFCYGCGTPMSREIHYCPKCRR